MTQDSGRGADGRQLFPFGVMLFQESQQRLACLQVQGTWHAAGKYQKICVFIIRLLKQTVCSDRNAMAPSHCLLRFDGYQRHFRSGPAQQICGRQRLYFLKSFCQKYTYFFPTPSVLCHSLLFSSPIIANSR